MDLQKLIGDRTAALPEQLMPIIQGIINGDVVSLVCLVELRSGDVGDLFELNMNDGESNLYAVLGAIEALKRDFMRVHFESRVAYQETEEQDDE